MTRSGLRPFQKRYRRVSCAAAGRGRSIGFGRRKRRAFRELLKQTVEFIVPYKYSYQNRYSCSPPPFFMVGISLLQIVIFAYNSAVMYQEIKYIGVNGPVPYCSRLIYNPDRREEVWRFLTYMLIHSGVFHATFNILVQLVLGIPLEMVHGKIYNPTEYVFYLTK
jgi:rhomboid-related protein 1/2/3